MKLYRFTAVLCLLLIMCSCAQGTTQNKDDMTPPSKEGVSVQESVFESTQESAEPESDIPDVVLKNYDEEWSNLKEAAGIPCEILTKGDSDSKYEDGESSEKLYVDCKTLVDNETALSELLTKHRKLTAEETYLILNKATYTYGPDMMGYIIHTAINFTVPAVGQEIAFIRTTNNFINSDSRWSLNGTRCYTVFESELGGYVYIFFDWYPEDTGLNTKLRRVFYCNGEYTTDDISTVKGSINKFVELYPEFKALEKMDEDGIVVNINILLKDGAFIAGTYKGAKGEFMSDFLFEGNTVPPENNSDNEADILDITILPQDYPSAN